MPLSEREQKLLEQLEQQLNADDPGLAQSLNREGSRGAAPAAAYSVRHLVLGVLIAVAGLGVVIAGVAAKLIILGVLGFLIMVAGVYYAATGRGKGAPAKTTGTGGKTTASAGRSSFMQNLERKWDERQGRR